VIEAAPMGFLATLDVDQPRVRPIAPYVEDFTFWVIAFADSAKVREIQNAPKVGIAFAAMFGEEFATVNVLGRAGVVETADEKRRVWDVFPDEVDLFQYFSGPEDPRFALIRIDPDRIECSHPDHPQPDVYRFE
jgi:general stress protein 26